jgi:23S rRNA (guanosine2251-2'-O)-methyltransferase
MLHQVDMQDNIAIVMGSEGKGIRQKTAKCCDFLVKIPMVNADLGFNVSVAAGIALYEVQKQRRY